MKLTKSALQSREQKVTIYLKGGQKKSNLILFPYIFEALGILNCMEGPTIPH